MAKTNGKTTGGLFTHHDAEASVEPLAIIEECDGDLSKLSARKRTKVYRWERETVNRIAAYLFSHLTSAQYQELAQPHDRHRLYEQAETHDLPIKVSKARGKTNRINLYEVIPAMHQILHDRRYALRRDRSDDEPLKDRRERLELEIKETELAERRGNMIPRADVEAAFAEFVNHVQEVYRHVGTAADGREAQAMIEGKIDEIVKRQERTLGQKPRKT